MNERATGRGWIWVLGAVLVLASTAGAEPMLDTGDEAPVFMLYAYNESLASDVAGTNTPSLGNFLGVSPEKRRDAVLLVFLSGSGDAVVELEELARLQRKYATWGNGLQVLAVCVDPREGDINDALAVARGVNYPVLRDRFGVAADRYGVSRNDAPVSFLLVGERPNVQLTPSEQAAIKEAYLGTAYAWTVRIVGRWTGGLAAQEDAVTREIESVIRP